MDVRTVRESAFSTQGGSQIAVIMTLFIILLSMGMANLYSASSGAGTDYFSTQLRHLSVGMVAFFIVAFFVPTRWMNTMAWPTFGVICALLGAVLFLGYKGGGAQRWIQLGPVGVQPSEFAKIAVALIVAWFFQRSQTLHPYRLRDLWPVFLTVGSIFFLIFKQPDLGTAGICLMIGASQVLFVRLDIRSVAISASAALVMGILGWSFFLRPYQKLRILNLLNPDLDPSGSGYNSLQSLIAIGSGELFGKGWMQGSQTQLQFLPARHTDFIFSVFSEEHGFWGSLLVFALFAWFIFSALEIARRAKNTFCSLLAVGLTALFFIEFVINVSMVLGLFPVVGMPLPFFSFGGSSLMTFCIATGILVAIDRDSKGKPKFPGLKRKEI